MAPGPTDPATALLAARPTAFTYQRFAVRVVEGPDAGKIAVAPGDELAIGTAPENHLVLTDPTVSRHHCAVRASTKGPVLRDLGSSNGTHLAGCRVDRATLRAGAVFEIGLTKLRFEGLSEQLREPLGTEERFGRVVGRSVAMGRIFAALPTIAGSHVTVLLQGETGTGKGVLAEAIHEASPRAKGPFVAIDCASLPPNLIESELFGYEKGAFTGAHAARRGAFEAAQGGTVFLDEIGELPLDLQPKLLRVLEERTIKRLGRTDPTRLDVRVIAATHRDLRENMNAGRFRADLFFRLTTVRIDIPPLRERREDIPLLVASFHQQIAGDPGATPPTDLVETLARQDWPGNARELRAAVERAFLFGDANAWTGGSAPNDACDAGRAGDADPSGFRFDPSASYRAAKVRLVAEWERWYIEELLRRHDGNLSRAARAARTDRGYLRTLANRYGLIPTGE